MNPIPRRARANVGSALLTALITATLFAIGFALNAQDTPFPMEHNNGIEPVDCASCMSYLDMVKTIDTIAQTEWALMTTFNRHWHPGAPPAGQTHTYDQLRTYMVDVMIDNTFRWHRLIDEWVRWTGIPTDNDTIPCEWTCTEWGECVDGVRRRQCISNGHCHAATDIRPPIDTVCTDTPPPPAYKWASDFETVGQCLLVATAGQNLAAQYGCPRVQGGTYYAKDPSGAGYNEAYPCTITGVTEIRLANWQELGSSNYNYLLRCTTHASGETADIRKRPNGTWFMDMARDINLTPTMDGADLVLTLPEPVVVTSLFGPNPWPWKADAVYLR